MFRFLRLWLAAILRVGRSRQDLRKENLALRQQPSVFRRRNRRPKLAVFDKLFWVFTRRFWSGWKNALIIVSPETVVRWHLQRGVAQGMRDAVIEICAVQNNEFS